MNLNSQYENALTYSEYVDLLGENLSLHELHYKKFSISEKYQSILSRFKLCKILAITEPWCGDSLALLPIIRKISEENDQWEMRIMLRDSNLEFMDEFLTRGARGIPIFLFLNEKSDLLFKWGPRPKAASDIFESYRDQINEEKIDKKEVIKKIRVYYAKDRGVTTLTELMEVFDKHHL